MQKQEKFVFEGHQSTFWIKMQFGIGHPSPTHQLQSTCVGEGSRVPNLQTEFNYLDSFKSCGIFSDFVVSVVPTLCPSSPCHPHCPHVIPIAPRRSPCGPHGCGLCGLLRCLRGLHPMLSPSSPCHPHIIPTAPRRTPCGPHGCGLHGLLHCLCGLHPMLSPWSPSSPCCPHIIPNPPDTHSTHPPPPWGVGAPNE